jgi:hypothetical protein
MSNWFKKLFSGKCSCEHCDCEEKKEEVNQPVSESAPVAETKPETENVENIEKV